MKYFVTVHLDPQQDQETNLALRQRLASALATLDLHSSVSGRKGTVILPRHCFAGVHQIEDSGAEKTLQLHRGTLSDRLSAVLHEVGFRGQFFLTINTRSCWAYRPVPRHADVGKHSDLDRLNLDANPASSP